jgi:hypothetical protein
MYLDGTGVRMAMAFWRLADMPKQRKTISCLLASEALKRVSLIEGSTANRASSMRKRRSTSMNSSVVRPEM